MISYSKPPFPSKIGMVSLLPIDASFPADGLASGRKQARKAHTICGKSNSAWTTKEE